MVNKLRRMFLGLVLIVLGVLMFLVASWQTAVSTQKTSSLVEERQKLLSNAISLPRGVYEQLRSYQPKLDAGLLPMFIVGVILILAGVFVLLGELDYFEQVKTRAHVFFIAGLLVAVLTFSPSAYGIDSGPRWYASAEIPQNITWYGYNTVIDEAEANIQVQVNRLSSGFVAFYLGIGDPNTKEWVAIGYYQNNTGFHLYADSYINNQYSLVVYGDASVGATYRFNVTSIGSVGSVWLNNVKKYDITFSATSTHRLYMVQSESTDTFNSLNITYTQTKVGFRTYDYENGWRYYYNYWPQGYVKVIQDAPYTISFVTGSGVEAVVTSGGNLGGGGSQKAKSNAGGTGGSPTVR